MNNQSYKNKTIYLLFLTGLAAIMLLIIGLLVTTAAASSINAKNESVVQDLQGSNLLSHAGSFNDCMVERYNQTKPASETSLNCTANDVGLASYSLVSGPAVCIEGEDLTVTLMGQFVSTSSERWDVGLFVSTDGGDPNTLGGTCYNCLLYTSPSPRDRS